MDVLRRLKMRAGDARHGLASAPLPVSAARRVAAGAWVRRRMPFGRLTGQNRRLATALEQLRDGVPLNWGQVEDDPELATLARLSQARQECRLEPIVQPSPEVRAALVERLAPKLRKPRPVEQPVKEAPRALAGFSERVQVLTQVEDNVDTGNNWFVFAAKAAAVVGAVVLVFWGVTTVLSLFNTPGFGWIELHRGRETVSRVARARTWIPQPCRNQRAELPTRPRPYQTLPAVRDAAELAGYRLPLVPMTLTTPITLTMLPVVSSIDLCNGPRSVAPPDRDEAAVVKLQYEVEKRMFVAGGKVTDLGKGQIEQVITTTLTVYAGYQQPMPLDVSEGTWHEVRDSGMQGVYWHGNPYRDISGAQWLGETGVLMVEKSDVLVTLITPIEEGINEDALLEIARRMSWGSD